MTSNEVLKSTVNEVIAYCPRAVEVFARWGIDSCCGGGLPIEEAARRHGADPADVLAALKPCLSNEAA